MLPLCQICCNPKRKLRFHTEQLSICQWWITELSNSETSPATLIEERRRSAMSKYQYSAANQLSNLRRQLAPPPQVPNAALEQVSQYAESSVRRDEGIMQSLYRSMIDDTRRRDEVAAVGARRKADLLAAHRAAITAHTHLQREIEVKIKTIESSILRFPEIIELEIKKFWREALTQAPTTSKEMKLLRAFDAGLLGFDRSEYARLDPEEYDDQKRRIRARDSFRCVRCLRGFAQGELHVHHVLPLYRCGTNTDSNLVTLCHPCHQKQHKNIQVTRSFPIKRRAPTSRFVAIDIETTGFSTDDSIIEISAARFVDGEVEAVFCSLVRTKRPIPAVVTRLTGITQSMISEAPHPEIVIRNFVEFVSNHRLVFHNAPFDMRYINKYLIYFDLPTPKRILDTLPIARKKLPQLSSHRLVDLVEHFGIPITRSHRAKDDSLATGRVYLSLREVATPRPKLKKKNQRGTKAKNPKAAAAVQKNDEG